MKTSDEQRFPRIRVTGTPFERGRQYGELAKPQIRETLSFYREVFAHYAGWDWGRVLEYVRQFVTYLERHAPRHLEEMDGIAKGAGVELPEVAAVNARTEVMFAASARNATKARKVPLECSSFASMPRRSGNGVIIGQNWDWLIDAAPTVVVLEVIPDEGPNFVTVVEAGLLAKFGFNSAGIGLATNALVTDADRGRPGIPYHLLLRSILESETVSDALSVLQNSHRAASGNFLVAHRDGLALDVETAPGDFSRLFVHSGGNGVILHANHFAHPSFDLRDVSLWLMPDSPFRLERLSQLVEETEGPIDEEFFMRVSSDHAMYPLGVCCHPDPRVPRLEQSGTLASVVMALDSQVMWLAEGPPCSQSFSRLDYSQLLSKPSRLPVPEGFGD